MSVIGAIIPAAGYAVTTAATGYAIGFAIQYVSGLGTAPQDYSPEALLKFTGQIALNGVAVMAASRLLGAQDDPTGGVLFTVALAGAQPKMFWRFQKAGFEMEKQAKQALGVSTIRIPHLVSDQIF